MKRFFFLLLLLFTRPFYGFSQTNILFTNPAAEQVITGNYDPQVYTPAMILNHPDSIIHGVLTTVNADSLLYNMIQLASLQNRNTGADTVSSVKGIGAARRWVHAQFEKISNQNNSRLLPGYLQFDQLICGAGQHRSPMAVLPGLDTSDPSIIIIEAHLDSRCEGLCDTACVAEGVDDNGSGTSLVIEAARVLSRYCFKHTIVFLTNIGEEQGLYGAEAFATVAENKNILIRAVQNNDIVAGVRCGQTASPPSCSPFGEVDSTQIRLFSYGGVNSPHKSFVRYIKLEYRENILPQSTVKMSVSIMTPEDRTGRGGDHQPFRQHGYTAMRFTSANENGNANVSDPDYEDNQHTSRDVLGYDTDGDAVVDSFLVDKNYLKRNTQINVNAAAMAAIGVLTPEFNYSLEGNQLNITVADPAYEVYRVGIRTNTYDFDSVYTLAGNSGTIHLDMAGIYYVSVAAEDSNKVESFFSEEQIVIVTGLKPWPSDSGIELLPMHPNPADEATTIVIYSRLLNNTEALLRITGSNGVLVSEIPLIIQKGLNEVNYRHTMGERGLKVVQLMVDEKIVATKNIVFTR
jgi:hypothetical protein